MNPFLYAHSTCKNPHRSGGTHPSCAPVPPHCTKGIGWDEWLLPLASLKGSLSMMRISCSIALVQPSSLSSKAKTSWKDKTSSLATAAFLGVQEFKPSRFNFSRSFPCHCSSCFFNLNGKVCLPP